MKEIQTRRATIKGTDNETFFYLSLKVYCVRKTYLRNSARSVNSLPSGALNTAIVFLSYGVSECWFSARLMLI